MFGKKESDLNKNSVSKNTASGLGSINSLSEGTSVEGSMMTKGDMRIDGTLKGNLDCGGRLILGKSGYIEGHVKCHSAVIEGHINGNLDVQELLDVKESAILTCEIKTGQMRMQAGAQFQGKCQMGGQVLAGMGNSKPSKQTKAAAS